MKLLLFSMIISIWRWQPSWKAWDWLIIQSKSILGGLLDLFVLTMQGIAGSRLRFVILIRIVGSLGREWWLSPSFRSIFDSAVCCRGPLKDFFFRIRTFPKGIPCMLWVNHGLHLYFIENLGNLLFEEWIWVEMFDI